MEGRIRKGTPGPEGGIRGSISRKEGTLVEFLSQGKERSGRNKWERQISRGIAEA
jgi:hypothetical protein